MVFKIGRDILLREGRERGLRRCSVHDELEVRKFKRDLESVEKSSALSMQAGCS